MKVVLGLQIVTSIFVVLVSLSVSFSLLTHIIQPAGIPFAYQAFGQTIVAYICCMWGILGLEWLNERYFHVKLLQDFSVRRILPILIPTFILFCVYNFNSFILQRMIPGWLGLETDVIADNVVSPVFLGVLSPARYVPWTLDFLGPVSAFALFVVLARRYSLLRATQVTAFMLMLLPIEVYFTQSYWFNLYVMNIQHVYNIATWFTNADLFYVSTSMLVVISIWSVASARLGLSFKPRKVRPRFSLKKKQLTQ